MSSNVSNHFQRPNSGSPGINFLDLKQSEWGIDGVRVTVSAEQINEAGSGGTAFPYEAYWLATNGDDNGTGAMNDPFQTPDKIIDNASGPNIIIHVLDKATYSMHRTLTTNQNITFVGSGYTITSSESNQPAVTLITGTTLSFYGAKLLRNGTGDVLTFSTGGAINLQDVETLTGNITGAGTLNGYVGTLTGNLSFTNGAVNLVTNTFAGSYTGSGSSIIRMIANSASLGWTLSGSASAFASITSTGSGFAVTNTGTGSVVGTFGSSTQPTLSYGAGINFNNQSHTQVTREIVPKAGNQTISKNDGGKIYLLTTTETATFTLPQYIDDPDFPLGFTLDVQQGSSGGILTDSLDPVESEGGKNWTSGRGARVTVTLIDIDVEGTQYTWALSGQLANSAP